MNLANKSLTFDPNSMLHSWPNMSKNNQIEQSFLTFERSVCSKLSEKTFKNMMRQLTIGTQTARINFSNKFLTPDGRRRAVRAFDEAYLPNYWSIDEKSVSVDWLNSSE